MIRKPRTLAAKASKTAPKTPKKVKPPSGTPKASKPPQNELKSPGLRKTDARLDANKPDYYIPSMKEVKEAPKNGLKGISLFSGCGGSSLGYKMAGYEILLANEFISAAQATYMANHKGTIMDPRDIRLIDPEDILNFIGMKPGELDLLDGSPPCRSFTTIPKPKRSDWGRVTKYSDSEQRTDDLFLEFARLVKAIQPKVFVAENVSGLVKGKSQGMFLEFFKILKDCGYQVQAKVLDACNLGVPQRRKRLFFIGVRNDLNLEPVFPEPYPYIYSIRDAIPWIDLPDSLCHPVESECYFNNKDGTQSSIAREWHKTPVGGSSLKYLNLKRSHPDHVAFTVTASTGCAVPAHPFIPRAFSIEELKLICSFPEDFILLGNYEKQAERLGRAVPPLMMKAIAEALLVGVFSKL